MSPAKAELGILKAACQRAEQVGKDVELVDSSLPVDAGGAKKILRRAVLLARVLLET